ncbi:MAG: hypothetical protein VCC02_13065 [Myxococcota bacterium]
MRAGSARRSARIAAALLPPLLLSLFFLSAAEAWLRWNRFGGDALTQPFDYMAPAWRDVDCFRPGPSGELMTPDCRMRYKGAFIATNGRGLHDREFDTTAPHYRIVVLGDSVSMAAGVERDETYHAVLEKRVNTDLGAPGFVEFENFGRGGRTTAQQISDLEAALRMGPVDAALIALTPGSLWGNLRDASACQDAAGQPAIGDADLRFHERAVRGLNPISNALHWLEAKTGLWAFRVPQDAARRIALSLRTDEKSRERSLAIEARATALFRACAARLHEIAEREGIDLAWVVLWYQPSRHGEILETELRELGEVVLPTPHLLGAFPNREAMVIYPGEVHPNAAVHRAFAEKLRSSLGDLGWFERAADAQQRAAMSRP